MGRIRTFWARRAWEQKCLLVLAVACVGMLAFALVAQYGFGLHPCHLCLWQRVPYAALAALGVGAVWLHGRALRVAAWAAVATLAGEAVLAFYHAGVEKNIFPGPDACSGGSAPGDSLEELRRQIMEAPLVSCSQTMAEWMGLSMAAWNGLAALGMAVMLALALRRRRA